LEDPSRHAPVLDFNWAEQRGTMHAVAQACADTKRMGTIAVNGRSWIGRWLWLACVWSAAACAADPLLGSWQFNAQASNDTDEAFDGKLRRESYPVPQTTHNPNPNARERSQSNYWETVRAGRERHSAKNLRRLGTAYPMVKSIELSIAAEPGGYVMTYDRELPRSLRPNPTGRVFSAKGDELVHDTFGYTLTYWDGVTLVVEADAPDGGKVIERLAVRENPHQLEYKVEIDLPVLEEPVSVIRIFDPAGTAR
jgi:hypothetical protein